MTTLVQVRGTIRAPDGTPAPDLVVTFRLDRPLRDPASNLLIEPVTIRADVSPLGVFAVSLAANDDPALEPPGSIYLVLVSARGTSESRSIIVPLAGAALGVELAAIATSVPGPLSFVYALSSTVTALDGRVVVLESGGGVAAAVEAHRLDTTDVHGIADTAAVVLTSDTRLADARTPTAHTQLAASITDLTETVQDVVAGLLGAGSNITLFYDDAANTLAISAVGDGTGLDVEAVRDAIGIALVGIGNIAVVVNDAADTITISTTATVNATDAALRDRSTHSGVQPVSSVTGLQAELDTKQATAAAAATYAALSAGALAIGGTPVPDSAFPATLARDTEVAAAVAALVAAAPGTLDTLDELAAALGDDPNFAVSTATALAGKQPLDSDLTAIAAVDSAVVGVLASEGAGWLRRSYAQVKASLALVKADVGLGLADNTADSGKPVSAAQQTALDAKLAVTTASATYAAVSAGLLAIAGTPVPDSAYPATLARDTEVAAAVAASQPLDSDLTAIATLATTAYGRSFLDRVDAAAGRTILGVVQPDVQVFLASGTWTKPAGVTAVQVFLVGGGGGGGGGYSGTGSRGGGGGGGGAAIALHPYRQSALGSTEVVTVGAAGTGGAGSAALGGGSSGIPGGVSRFGPASTKDRASATGGNAGFGSTGTSGGAAGVGGAVGTAFGGNGGAGGAGAAGAIAATVSISPAATGGGGGGGVSATPAGFAGGPGGTTNFASRSGGTAGAAEGGDGGTSTVVNDNAGSTGGGGGGGSSTGLGGTGGTGTFPGGGGGGGGAGLSGSGGSGPGGAGADGLVVVISW